MRRPSPLSASTRAGMTVFFAQSTKPGSENVVLSMILHGPHHDATTSSMTGLFSALARLRISAKGLPSTNGMWTAGGEEGRASARAACEATSAPATAATRAGNLKRFSLIPVSYTHLRAHETRHDLV